MNDPCETVGQPQVGSDALVRRVVVMEAELQQIKIALGLGGWLCQCCKVSRPKNWLSYRVRKEKTDAWIEPACALCARVMWSEGPFPPPNTPSEPSGQK